MNSGKRSEGFTLLEVMAVIIIIAALAAIAIPRLASSTVSARQKADIATAHEVKTALDRYQVENGRYLKTGELTADKGTVTGASLIPKYISKLEASITQQAGAAGHEGFGIAALKDDNSIPEADTVANIIMIYLSSDGSAAEVRAYDESLKKVLWTSAN